MPCCVDLSTVNAQTHTQKKNYISKSYNLFITFIGFINDSKHVS